MFENPDQNRRTLLKAGAGVAAAGVLGPIAWKLDGANSETRESDSWESSIVFFDENGKLVYRSDEERNRIPDFSYAGYHNGERELPRLPVRATIRPVRGDNTSHIQAAVDAIGSLPKDENGFRGAVLLEAGTYRVKGRIYINRDGIVLRGVGDGEDPTANTIIQSYHEGKPTPPIWVGDHRNDTKWMTEVPGTRTDIVTPFIPVGARTFRLQDAPPLSVGDNVIIVHPCTEKWLEAVHYGDTGTAPRWQLGSLPIMYNRFVAAISGNEVTVDAPVFNHLNRELAQCYVYKWDREGLVTEVGVENLHVDIEAKSEEDEDHAPHAIVVRNVQDGWIQNCTMRHFRQAGIKTYRTTRTTIANCKAIEPASEIRGRRRYNFLAADKSQLILFRNCLATQGRHSFSVASGGNCISGIVFLRCISRHGYVASEGHGHWSQGLLYDRHTEVDPQSPRWPWILGFYNRSNRGGGPLGGHGWGAVHSVVWNAQVISSYSNSWKIVVQKPPTAQNYAIGCSGDVNVTAEWRPGNRYASQELGFVEGSGEPGLYPESLYESQLVERISS